MNPTVRFSIEWTAIMALSAVLLAHPWCDCPVVLNKWYIIVWAFFAFMSLQLFFVGRLVAKLPNKSAYIGFIMVITFLRLFGVGTLVLLSRNDLKGVSILCTVVPLMLIYLLTTAHESIWLVKLGKEV
jgi:hypothetical protein